MSRKKTKVERDFSKTMKDLTSERSRILDEFCKAFMIEKGVLPSQVKLVEKQEYGMVSWHFAMKEPEVSGLKKQWFLLKFHLRTLKFKIQKCLK